MFSVTIKYQVSFYIFYMFLLRAFVMFYMLGKVKQIYGSLFSLPPSILRESNLAMCFHSPFSTQRQTQTIAQQVFGKSWASGARGVKGDYAYSSPESSGGCPMGRTSAQKRALCFM